MITKLQKSFMRLVMQELIQTAPNPETFCPTIDDSGLSNKRLMETGGRTKAPGLVWYSQEEVDKDSLVRSILAAIRHIDQIHARTLTPLPQLSGELDPQQKQKSEDIYKR